MADIPNIVNIEITSHQIEIIDNNKVSNNITILESDNNVQVVNSNTTVVSPVTQEFTVVNTAPVAPTVVETSVVKTDIVEVVTFGPQGSRGNIGPQGESILGPRGPRGTGITILGTTSSLYISSSTYDVGELEKLETGSFWILTDTNDFGNGISGSINDGVVYNGLPWANTGPVRGSQGETGLTGVGISGAQYNQATGIITFTLSNGDPGITVGPVKGADGNIGANGDDGVGIANIFLEEYDLNVQLTDQAAPTNLGNIRGPQGPRGSDGQAGDKGDKGDTGAPGNDGATAYELWIAQGNTGDEAAYIASLKGEQGIQGIQGVPGENDLVGSGVLATDFTASLWTDYYTNFGPIGYITHGDTFAAGTPIETLLRAMLSQSRPELPAAVNNFKLSYQGSQINNSSLEIGTPVNIDAITFTTTGTVTIGGVRSELADVNFGTSETPIDVGDTSPSSIPTQTVTRSAPGNIRFRLSHTAGGDKQLYKSFRANIYAGGSNILYDANMTSANAQTLINSIKGQYKSLESTRSFTANGSSLTATAGYYTYIVYPASLGELGDIQDPNGNTLQPAASPTFTRIETSGDLLVGNDAGTSGFTYAVYVYVSAETQQLSATDVITIT